ncbi:chemotaxis protein CheB [Halalkalibacillus halophilus]|uniref:chemotaxis protein CheB n=1 Tax=Halalkalibacillus halophilus TaxID=392827 RepID=UPI000480C024|nr:chemotaxis protein CheB [Halalkalibacillus halophilus]
MKNQGEQYYVGIGASAGGLESLEAFFKSMSEESGLTFIIVQHLSPDFKSHMDELLSRDTNMQIHVAEDGMETAPNTIYLIPPRKNLELKNHKLYLSEQDEQKHLNLPIDLFFRSLAKDQEKNSIGIVLSGTGSDGTLGVRAIKEAGGMVMSEDESTAKFDGMPKSAIATGLVDYILPPQQMGEELLNFIKHPIKPEQQQDLDNEDSMDVLTRISIIMKNYCDIDFQNYKETTLMRRVHRRVKINHLQSVNEYVEYLSNSNKEKDILKRELFIGVTSFFRDQEAYESLEKNVLPNIDYTKDQIRVWSAGCSTGEEVYSLAIMFREYMEKNGIKADIKLFATDVDDRALAVAGQGFYPESVISDIEPHLISKYFVKKEDGYQVSSSIRKMVVFAKHNILNDPPFSRLDLLTCRNLFIYLKNDYQRTVLSKFYYSLNPSGFLFLGSSESLGEMSEAYEVVDQKWKIYKYKEGFQPKISTPNLIGDKKSIDKKEEPQLDEQSVKLEKLLSEAVSELLPPSLLIDKNDQIIHVINNMSPYLATQPGQFSNNFNTNMTRELTLFVNNVLRRLKQEKDEVKISNAAPHNKAGKSLTLKGNIINVYKQDYYLVSFEEEDAAEFSNDSDEVDMSEEMRERVKYLESELQSAREGLQATVEELETSNEELQSSNEELTASNEELQSTNQELQSVNEELYTVNSEYQDKIDELTKANNDLYNLLKNTEVGALYLDSKLKIRKITPVITEITNVMDSDMGRPISHITVMKRYPDLSQDIHKVLEELVEVEKEIRSTDDRFWLVRIRPYRTEYYSVEGVIVTFVDISSLKDEREKAKEGKDKLSQAMRINQMVWWEYNIQEDQLEFSVNHAEVLGLKKNQPLGIDEIKEIIHPEDVDQFTTSFNQCIKGEATMIDINYRLQHEDGHFVWYSNQGEAIDLDKNQRPTRLVGTVMNINDYKD